MFVCLIFKTEENVGKLLTNELQYFDAVKCPLLILWALWCSMLLLVFMFTDLHGIQNVF